MKIVAKIPKIIDLGQNNKAKMVITNKGIRIFYSYDTPIAMYCPKNGKMYRFNEKLISNTTARQYNAFVRKCNCETEYGGHIGFSNAKQINCEQA